MKRSPRFRCGSRIVELDVSPSSFSQTLTTVSKPLAFEWLPSLTAPSPLNPANVNLLATRLQVLPLPFRRIEISSKREPLPPDLPPSSAHLCTDQAPSVSRRPTTRSRTLLFLSVRSSFSHPSSSSRPYGGGRSSYDAADDDEEDESAGLMGRTASRDKGKGRETRVDMGAGLPPVW